MLGISPYILSMLLALPAADSSHIHPADSLAGGQLREAVAVGTHDVPIMSGQTIGYEKLSVTQSIADALHEMAGVQVKDYGGVGGLKTINVRSLGSEHTGVYIDGIQVENAQNMQVDLGRFSTDGLADITIYNGQRSMRLQSAKEYASGNSLYLTSAAPMFLDGRKSAFSIRLRGGSFGTVSPSLSYGRKIGNSMTGSLSAELTSSDGQYKFHSSKYLQQADGSIAGYDTTMVRKNGDITAFRVEGRLEKTAGTAIWKAHAYYYDSERGLPGAVVRTADGMLPGYGDRQADRDFFVQGSWRRSFHGTLRPELLVRGKYGHNYTRYRTDPEKNPQSMPADVTYRQHSGYLSASGAMQPGKWWSVNAAIDIQYNALDGNPQNFARPERFSTWGALASYFEWGWGRACASALYTLASDRYDNAAAGAFAREDKSRSAFSPALIFSLSPWKGADGKGIHETGLGREGGSTGNGEMVTDGSIMPMGRNGNMRMGKSSEADVPDKNGVTWETPVIDGFVKRSFRMPSFNDLYYTLIGNSALKSETAWQFDVGITWPVMIAGRMSVLTKAEVWHNIVEDKIVAIPTANMFRWTMYNIGKVNATGADVMMTLEYGGSRASGGRRSGTGSGHTGSALSGSRSGTGLSGGKAAGRGGFSGALTLKYTYQRSADRSDPASSGYGGQIPYIPLHSGSASVCGKWRGWRMDVTAIATGERWSSSANFIDYHIAPWWTADISMAKEIRMGGCGLLFTLSLRNVLNRQYEVVQGYPMPGMNVLAGIGFRF